MIFAKFLPTFAKKISRKLSLKLRKLILLIASKIASLSPLNNAHPPQKNCGLRRKPTSVLFALSPLSKGIQTVRLLCQNKICSICSNSILHPVAFSNKHSAAQQITVHPSFPLPPLPFLTLSPLYLFLFISFLLGQYLL